MSERIPFSNVPEGLMSAMLQLEKYVNNNGFSTALLELIRLRVSQINGCAYCIDMHYKEALAADLQPVRLYSLPVWREAPYYSEDERAILAWTEALIARDGSDLQILYHKLSAHFSQSQIANLTVSISQINAWNILAKSFGFTPGAYVAGSHA